MAGAELSSAWRLDIEGRYFFTVWIWETEDALLRATCQSKHGVAVGAHFGCYEAWHWWLNSDGQPVPDSHIGSLHFVRGLIGGGKVAHELMHAMSHWCEIWGLDWQGKDEEGACYLMQDLTNGFWVNFYERYEPMTSS